MGPFDMSQDGNKYVAIAVDAFTKFVEAKGIAHKLTNFCGDHDHHNKSHVLRLNFPKIPYRGF